MLKKYENFYKQSKTKECSFYQANLREDMNKVLMKRIKSAWSWNQMLKSNALKIQSTQSFFPKVLQIFRHNGSYFVVYEKLNGPSLCFADASIKLEMLDFYQVCTGIINNITELRKEVSNLYIYPEWVFLHRNGAKLCHFEPYFQPKEKSIKQQGHVFLYDMMKGSYKKEQEDQIHREKRIKNINFNLGYIAYHLLTGQVTQLEEDQLNYHSKIKEIQKTARSKIIKQTNDQKLASLISTLLTFTTDPNDFQQNQDENYAFEQFRSFVNRKNIECKAVKNKQSFRIVEFSLQKMKLQKKMSKIKVEKKKKCVRPCCFKNFQVEPNPEDQYDDKFQVVDKNVKSQKVVILRSNRLATQNISSQSHKKMQERSLSNKKIVSRHKISSSCVFPELVIEKNDSLFKEKIRSHQNRSTMFRKSMQGVGTIRKYLKTEY